VQKKNVTALSIMVLLLLVLAIFVINEARLPSLFVHRSGVVKLPNLYFHYYGCSDGISLLVVDHVSLKQLKQGEKMKYSHRQDVRGNFVRRGKNHPWGRSRFRNSEANIIELMFYVEIHEERRWIQISTNHELYFQKPFLAFLNIEGRTLKLSRDTIVFVDHQLDGSFTVNQIETDLTALVGFSGKPEELPPGLVGFSGKPEELPPGSRGVPDRDDIKTYLLESSFILELLGGEKQEQK
jgi:hypothetical protein